MNPIPSFAVVEAMISMVLADLWLLHLARPHRA
jgi:hypothetical protein